MAPAVKDSDQHDTSSHNGAEEQFQSAELLRVLEAVLFASEEILSGAKLKSILPGEPDARQIRKLVEKLNTELQQQRHPFEIVELAGGYQFRTVSYYSPWVRQLFKEKTSRRLSIQALECLAIIAYQQPITKAEIEAVRGVVSDGAIRTLLERHLITIAGRSDKPGRPLLYSTTKEFLSYFGLRSIGDLPTIDDFEQVAKEKMGDLAEELEQMQQHKQDGGEEEHHESPDTVDQSQENAQPEESSENDHTEQSPTDQSEEQTQENPDDHRQPDQPEDHREESQYDDHDQSEEVPEISEEPESQATEPENVASQEASDPETDDRPE